MKEGRINLYGFKFYETRSNGGGKYASATTTSNYAFYYQKANEKYAFSYTEETTDPLNLLFVRKVFIKSFGKFLEDCPKLAKGLTDEGAGLSKEERAKVKEEFKITQKALKEEMKALPQDDIYKDLSLYHKYKYNSYDSMIEKYNNNDCQ